MELVRQCVFFSGTMIEPNIHCDMTWLERDREEKSRDLMQVLGILRDTNRIDEE